MVVLFVLVLFYKIVVIYFLGVSNLMKNATKRIKKNEKKRKNLHK